VRAVEDQIEMAVGIEVESMDRPQRAVVRGVQVVSPVVERSPRKIAKGIVCESQRFIGENSAIQWERSGQRQGNPQPDEA
jgi:hypothetical protein